jgi:hypothetical protein
MTATRTRHREHAEAEWSACPLRPVARWARVPDETGRFRLQMIWSVPDVAPCDVLVTLDRAVLPTV